MKRRASYLIILFIAQICVMQSMAQSSQPDVVCMGTTKNYFVNATPGSSYIWKIEGGSPEASTTNSVDINWNTSGRYTLTVQEKSKDNCLGEVQSLQVTVIESPTLQLTSDNKTESQKIYLGNAIKKITYRFGGGATGIKVKGLPSGVDFGVNGNTLTLSGTPTASGDYTITTDGGAPCAVRSLSGSITTNQLFRATISGTTITCQNAAPPAVTFTGIGGTAPYTFTYNINDGANKMVTTITGDTVTVSVPTTVSGTFVYNLLNVTDSIQYINPAGNDGVVSAKVEVTNPKTKMLADTICMGESCFVGEEEFKSTGIYTVTLKDSNGCDSIVTLDLSVVTGQIISQKIQLFKGEVFKINGNTYTEPETFTEIMKVGAKCDDVVITELSFINIPNTITPNDDGKNDVFMKDNHVVIYNRNGILLYDGYDGWDGKYNNRTVSKDTYFYILYYTSESGIKSKEGYLMVIP